MITTTPVLKNVIRLDSMPITRASFTDEGYLEDKPVLTTTGIFEYRNPDGSIRRELRLPQEVFSPESLASYKGKPIIITHEAGLITKENVAENQIGTILSEGIRSGNEVKADIIIHDVNAFKERGLKELSLGYNLDLDETGGTWNGIHYDAVQRNIRINHLALVRQARAGEQARLNVDSRDSITILRGGKAVKNLTSARRADSILSDEELEQAIAEYKAKRAEMEDIEEPVEEPAEVEKDAEEEIVKEAVEEVPAEEPVEEPVEEEAVEEEVVEEPVEEPAEEPVEEPEKTEADAEEEIEVPDTVEGKMEFLRERRHKRDSAGDPKNGKEAMVQIASQDEDIDMYIDIIDTLLAKMDFDSADEEVPVEEEEKEEEVLLEDEDDVIPAEEEAVEEEIVEKEPVEEEEPATDAEEEVVEEEKEEIPFEEQEFDEDEFVFEEEKEEEKPCHTDSADEIRERVALGLLGRELNLDGLEYMELREAKAQVIKAVKPNVRLDGKSDTYIDAAYDCAVEALNEKRNDGVSSQKKQMFNKDSVDNTPTDSAESARERMIRRQHKN